MNTEGDFHAFTEMMKKIMKVKSEKKPSSPCPATAS